MNLKTIGNTNITVDQIGLGCMGLSEFYGAPMDTGDAIKLLHEAIELGVNHFDTAEAYGIGSANEKLLGSAFHDKREKVRIATKFGPLRDPVTGAVVGLDGSRKNCFEAVERSLERLQTDHIDLYYLHRVDPNTPIEESVSAMAELLNEGKIGAIGLSEVSGDTLRRASVVHPIAAVQSEYSIFSRDIEADVIPACIETGTTLVAYSPLGRGMLAGSFKKDRELSDTDYRAAAQPRFAGEAYTANLALVEQITELARSLGVTPAEVALAWLMAKHDNLLLIAGTTKLANLKTNIASADVDLSDGDISLLDNLADKVQGMRYPEQGMALINP